MSEFILGDITMVCRPSKEKVLAAFPVEATNKNTIKTAREWVTGLSRHWPHSSSKPRAIPVEETLKNSFSNIKIHSLDSRGNGGRAYKVILNDRYLVDLRESEIVWCIFNVGIRAGGVIPCEFVFGQQASQTKLLAVGSPLHQKMSKGSDLRKLVNIKATELIPGHSYKNKRGDISTFIGHVYTVQIDSPRFQKTGRWWGASCSDGFKIVSIKNTKAQLWHHGHHWNRTDSPELSLEAYWDTTDHQCNDFELCQSKTVYLDLGKITDITVDDVRKRHNEMSQSRVRPNSLQKSVMVDYENKDSFSFTGYKVGDKLEWHNGY